MWIADVIYITHCPSMNFMGERYFFAAFRNVLFSSEVSDFI